jgi:hypothetical protein
MGLHEHGGLLAFWDPGGDGGFQLRYSVVIPAHNEGSFIRRYVAEFLLSLPPGVSEFLCEVVLVENGSSDGTLGECRAIQRDFPGIVRVLSVSGASYGDAIRAGILACVGSHLSILESDLLEARFVECSMSLFRDAGARFVVGSKRHPDSCDRRPIKRKLLTLGFNLILKAGTGYPGSDTHGLKSMETGLGKRLCELASTSDEVLQTELVLLAWRQGIDVYELPVAITEKRPATVSVARRVPKVIKLVSLLRASLGRFRNGRGGKGKIIQWRGGPQ